MDSGERVVGARLVERIDEIQAEVWDACAGADNPFVRHGFLSALEATGSVGMRTGWLPRHVIVQDDEDAVLAVMPTYIKGNSHGEYVFDWGWAEAYERAGGRYYPKLQVAVPFTPVPGPRILLEPATRDDPERAFAVRRAAIGALEAITEQTRLSSVHVTFCTASEWRTFSHVGWITRLGQQFHWRNRGYHDFDDFLGALTSRKRKTIRRERREVARQGIRLRAAGGREVTPAEWDAFYGFYTSTYDRKWGMPYLTREFFEAITDEMGDAIVLVLAELDGAPIAGALNFRGTNALFGRNWGAGGAYPFLHFEACYYQAIEYAIAHGLARVEAGTQGPHKVQRGYTPVRTYSAHYICDPRLREPVADFCKRESMAIEEEMLDYKDMSPYRKSGGDETGGR